MGVGKTQKRQTSEKSRRRESGSQRQSPSKATVGGKGLDSEKNALERQTCGVGQARGGAAETSALAKFPVGRFGQACLLSQGPGQGALLSTRMLERCQETEMQKGNWLLDAIRSNLGERDPTLAKFEVVAQTDPRADMEEKLKANTLHF